MSVPTLVDSFSVAVVGFSAFERQSLASFFRLAARRSPAYQQVDEAGLADFLIADADDARALAAVERGRRSSDTVFVGARAPQGASAWLPRPIDPMHILRELDVLVELRLAVPDTASGLLPLELPADDEAAPRAPAGADLPRAGPTPPLDSAAAPAAPRGGGGRPALVVEDSAVARRFLQHRLQRLGYRVDAVATGAAALERVAQCEYALACIDVVLGPPGGVDGLQVCQAIKQRAGATPTAVILTTGLNGASDRVRGSLAGADAYLVKPLMEPVFIATLHQVDPAFEWADESAASV